MAELKSGFYAIVPRCIIVKQVILRGSRQWALVNENSSTPLGVPEKDPCESNGTVLLIPKEGVRFKNPSATSVATNASLEASAYATKAIVKTVVSKQPFSFNLLNAELEFRNGKLTSRDDVPLRFHPMNIVLLETIFASSVFLLLLLRTQDGFLCIPSAGLMEAEDETCLWWYSEKTQRLQNILKQNSKKTQKLVFSFYDELKAARKNKTKQQRIGSYTFTTVSKLPDSPSFASLKKLLLFGKQKNLFPATTIVATPFMAEQLGRTEDIKKHFIPEAVNALARFALSLRS